MKDLFGNSNPHVDALRAATLSGGGGAPPASGVNVSPLDSSIAVSGNAIGVNLAVSSGLQISSGLSVKVADTSLSLGASGVAVNLAATSGLQVSSGLQIADSIAGAGLTISEKVLDIGATDTSVVVVADGIAVNLATNPGLEISSGLKAKVSGLGLSLGASGITLTSSSNPGAAASILASDAAGALQLTGLTLSGNLNTSRVASHLIPATTDTYDLGSSTLLWRKGYLSELDAVLFAENTKVLLGGWFTVGKDAGVLAADVAAANTTIDFGKAMAVGHFVEFRAALKVEYVQVGSLVSGTRYNVTRNLDGSGANDWPMGTPFSVNGTTGDGRIELNAYDTPRIQLIAQGATYNAQTEMVRIGDLNGNWNYGSQTFGVALGEFAAGKTSLTIDSASGIRIFNGTSTLIGSWSATGIIMIGQEAASQNNILISSGAISIRNNDVERIGMTAAGVLTISDSGGNAVFTFDASTGAEFTKPLTIGTSGGIYQGTGTFASPTTGLKIWNDGGVGRIAGYNGGTIQTYFGTDGKFYSGAGAVRHDANGIALVRGSTTPNKIRWMSSDFATEYAAMYVDVFGASNSAIRLYVDSTLQFSVAGDTGRAYLQSLALGSANSTGMAAGELRAVGALIGMSSTPAGYSAGDIYLSGGLNVGTATAAAAGEIKTSGGVGIGGAVPTSTIAKAQVYGNLLMGQSGSSYGISGYLGGSADWYALCPNVYIRPGVGWYYLANGYGGIIGFVNGQWQFFTNPLNSGGAGAAVGTFNQRLTISAATGNMGVDTPMTAAGVTYQKLSVNGSALLAGASSTQEREMIRFTPVWATSTDASRKARGVFEVYDTAVREAFRIEASGSAAMIGFLGAAAIVRPAATGSRGGIAALASLLTALANLGLVTDSTSA